jgi:hypothetical protein
MEGVWDQREEEERKGSAYGWTHRELVSLTEGPGRFSLTEMDILSCLGLVLGSPVDLWVCMQDRCMEECVFIERWRGLWWQEATLLQ